jgi:hypothetical protein
MRIVQVFEFAQERVMTSQSQRLRGDCVKVDKGNVRPALGIREAVFGWQVYIFFITVALALGYLLNLSPLSWRLCSNGSGASGSAHGCTECPAYLCLLPLLRPFRL